MSYCGTKKKMVPPGPDFFFCNRSARIFYPPRNSELFRNFAGNVMLLWSWLMIMISNQWVVCELAMAWHYIENGIKPNKCFTTVFWNNVIVNIVFERFALNMTSAETSSKREKKWVSFPGENEIICDGRFICAKEYGVLICTVFLILLVAILFLYFRYIQKCYLYYWTATYWEY